jgi:hypothetical protein
MFISEADLEQGTFMSLQLLHTFIEDVINIFMSVLPPYRLLWQSRDLLFHLCCVQSWAPRAMQMRPLVLKHIPSFRIPTICSLLAMQTGELHPPAGVVGY